jgi:hypothetical protein
VRVQASNAVLYAASGKTLSVFTVTNAAAPILIGQCETASGNIVWFQMRGQYVYALLDFSLEVLDVSNPARPMTAGSTSFSWAAYSIQVAGNYAYVAAGNGLQVLDVSVPSWPVLLTTNQNPGAAYGVDVAGGYAYLTTSEGFEIMSLANPAQPTLVGTNALALVTWGNRILTAGQHCYVTDGNRLEILDVADPLQPGSVGGYDTGGYTSDLALADHYAFVAAGAEGLQILDLSNPASPTLLAIGTRETGGPAEAIQVVGNYAYLADGNSGLQVIDVAGTNGLVRVGHLRTTNYARAINIVGNNAYVGTDAGLKIIDVSDPAMPLQLGSFDSGQVMDIQVVGNLAYLTGDTLQIVDVSIPAQPRQITNCAAVYSTRAVKVVGQLAYVTGWIINSASNQFNGLAVIDVLDPAAPRLVGSCPTVEAAQDVHVVGNLAYVNVTRDPDENGRPASWLQIIDITNPTQPTPLGQCPISEDAHRVQVVGHYAYIAGGSWREDAPEWRDGLVVVDVSDPANPTRVCGFSTPGWAAGIQVVGDQVYLADGPAGLAIMSLPTEPTGQLTLGIEASWTNVVVGYEVDLTGWIDGWAPTSAWDFGDGTALSNRLDVSHAWAAVGDYPIVLRAYNESNPGGVSATTTVHVVTQPTYYVAADNTNPQPPYTSWATAATNIQDAIDVADVTWLPPGSVFVLVTNGVYATGGRVAAPSGRVAGTKFQVNRVVVEKPLTLRSVNGPEVTIIQGYQVPGSANGDSAIRCAYLANGANLSGFTLRNGATRTKGDWWLDQCGGGVWCDSVDAVIFNCVITGNSAFEHGGGTFAGTLNDCTLTGNSAWDGGGADGYGQGCTLNRCTLATNSAGAGGGGARDSTLNNCILIRNSAGGGGGAADSTLNNCTLTANSAVEGGGTYGCTLNNCIVHSNTATNGLNYLQDQWSPINYSCTTPMPTNGMGNITNAPLFVDYAGGNLRLQSNSPCINAGNNAYTPGPTDLDGLPRIVGGTVDIGAYEFQPGVSGAFIGWLQQYGLPADGSADFTDPDRDGMNNWQEWRCGTCPTNALSVLRLLSAAPIGTSVTVTWQSVAGVTYFLERSTNLLTKPPFSLLAPNLSGQPGTTSFTDTNASAAPRLFYRVGVNLP